MTKGLTISQAAAFVGVTVKTVRHYHRLGLVDEPERDTSGYRRYGSSDLLRLVQVRTLAGAGVPLAEINELLEAGPEQFASAIADVQRRLNERIEDLLIRRDTLHRLSHGDRVLLPDRASKILDQLHDLGFSSDYVSSQWEGLVLFRALIPENFDDFLTLLERRLEDPTYVELTKRSWEAEAWHPDDQRVEELATAMAEHFLANPTLLGAQDSLRVGTDAMTRHGVINYHRKNEAPVSARLTTLIETKLRAGGIHLPNQWRRIDPADEEKRW